MNIFYLGVDPGIKGGAVAILDESGRPVRVFKIPTRDRGLADARINQEADPAALADILLEVFDKSEGRAVYAFVERPWANPGIYIATVASLFQSYGAIKAALEILGIHVTAVAPQTWQSQFGLLAARNKAKKEGEKKNKNKERSLEVARAKFPEIDLRQKQHNNIAEALLIAEWGRITHQRGEAA